ncbi:MAG: alginate export family protein [Phycisphaerae bacterium]
MSRLGYIGFLIGPALAVALVGVVPAAGQSSPANVTATHAPGAGGTEPSATATAPSSPTTDADDAAAAATQPAPVATAPARPPAAPGPGARFLSRAWNGVPQPEPPDYARPLSRSGIPGTEELTWLDFGLDHRTRYEYRDDDYRKPRLGVDDPFLMRSRGYIGVREVTDPLRLGFEFRDSRILNSDFPDTTGVVDEHDILQAYGELYFADALGDGQPFRFQFGRLSFSWLDDRLFARGGWANNNTAFDGFRLRAGDPKSKWELDFLAAAPVEVRFRRPDGPDDERWFYGLVGSWRGWSDVVTLEPFYFILDEDRKGLPTRLDREIHTFGLRAYGPIGATGFDYDVTGVYQFGEDGDRDQRAFAGWGELGYRIPHEWKPRISASCHYASGDRDPTDLINERFDKLFGSSSVLSRLEMFNLSNLIMPRARFEFQPHERIRFDTSYAAYFLASDNDAWTATGRRDPLGNSTDFIGQEIDCRLRFALDRRMDLEVGYSYFMTGDFTQKTGPADDSDFFYVATTLRF